MEKALNAPLVWLHHPSLTVTTPQTRRTESLAVIVTKESI